DPMFPGTGHVSIAVASGVPFAAIGEISIGTTEGFTLSAIGGVVDTLDEYGVGGRARVRVFRHRDAEIVLTLPVLYYPPVAKRGDEPWVLTNPSLVVAGRFSSVSLYGGAGVLVATCTENLVAHFDTKPVKGKERSPMVDGIWNTLHAGGSIALNARVDAFV